MSKRRDFGSAQRSSNAYHDVPSFRFVSLWSVPVILLVRTRYGFSAAALVAVAQGEISRRVGSSEIVALNARANLFLLRGIIFRPMLFKKLKSNVSYSLAFASMAAIISFVSNVAILISRRTKISAAVG